MILLEGINDIGFSGEPDTGCFAPNNATVTAAQIEAGYLQLIKMAHASGVKIFAGTLMPFLGSNCVYGGNFGLPQGEAVRESVNHWILTSHAFDGVVDFARATAIRTTPNTSTLPTTAQEGPLVRSATACIPTILETR